MSSRRITLVLTVLVGFVVGGGACTAKKAKKRSTDDEAGTSASPESSSSEVKTAVRSSARRCLSAEERPRCEARCKEGDQSMCVAFGHALTRGDLDKRDYARAA